MKLATAIQILKENPKIHYLSFGDGILLRFDADGKTKQPARFYAVNTHNPIGKGSFGVCYEAYPLITDWEKIPQKKLLNLIDKNKPFIAKFIRKDSTSVAEVKHEANALRSYYPTEQVISLDHASKHYYCILTQRHFGDNLNLILARLKKEKHDITFEDRVNLLASIVLSYNVIHHLTPSTGMPLQMSDIKPDNIIANFKNMRNKKSKVGTKKIIVNFSNYRPDVYPIDFGLAQTMEDFEKTEIEDYGTLQFSGPDHVPLKSGIRKGGIKSDIWSLAAIAISVLGGNPFVTRDKKIAQGEPMTAYLKAAYDTTDICNGMPNKKYICKNATILSIRDQIPTIKRFINRMQHSDYDQRPDPDEVLRFFITLFNFCKTYKYIDTLKLEKAKAKTPYSQAEIKSLIYDYLADLKKYIRDLNSLAHGNSAEFKTVGVTKTLNDGKQEIAIAPKTPAKNAAPQSENNNITIVVTPNNSKKPSEDLDNQTIIIEIIIKINNAMEQYLNKVKDSADRLTQLKALIAKAFLDEINKLKSNESIYNNIDSFKDYEKMLRTLNHAIEEFAENDKENHFKNLHLSDENKDSLLSLFREFFTQTATKSSDKNRIFILDLEKFNQNKFSLPENFTKSLVARVDNITTRKPNEKGKVHYGKHYLFFFSSRLGRVADNIGKIINDAQFNSQQKTRLS